MHRSPSLRRCVAVALVAALAACSSAPRSRSPAPTTLVEVNRALSRRFADVTLTNAVVMRGLRGVEVTPERLLWTNERGQRREMPIAEVERIVLRGRDPGAAPPSDGARLLAGASPPPSEPMFGTPVAGPISGEAAVATAALYGALYLLSANFEAPGVVIYEGPVNRYVTTPPGEPRAPETSTGSAEPPPS
jgi:hypothetical protein